MLLTFAMAVVGWIIFRAENIRQVGDVISKIGSFSIFNTPWLMNRGYYIPLVISIFTMLCMEWYNRREMYGLALNITIPIQWIRRLIYIILIILICYIGRFNYNQFIYFQF